MLAVFDGSHGNEPATLEQASVFPSPDLTISPKSWWLMELVSGSTLSIWASVCNSIISPLISEIF